MRAQSRVTVEALEGDGSPVPRSFLRVRARRPCHRGIRVDLSGGYPPIPDQKHLRLYLGLRPIGQPRDSARENSFSACSTLDCAARAALRDGGMGGRPAEAVCPAAALRGAVGVLTTSRDHIAGRKRRRGQPPASTFPLRAVALALDVLSEALRDGERPPSDETRAAALPFFVEVGRDSTKAYAYGQWPACSAARYGSAAALELLIKAGCDVNALATCSSRLAAT